MYLAPEGLNERRHFKASDLERIPELHKTCGDRLIMDLSPRFIRDLSIQSGAKKKLSRQFDELKGRCAKYSLKFLRNSSCDKNLPGKAQHSDSQLIIWHAVHLKKVARDVKTRHIYLRIALISVYYL